MKKRKRAQKGDPRPVDKGRRDFLKTMGIVGGTMVASGVSGPFFHARAALPEIRIGHATSLSGVYAVYGDRIDKGIRLAFSLSKYKERVKFFLEDTAAKPELAVQKAVKLYEKDKVHILYGPIAGHESAAISATLTPMKKLQIQAHGSNVYLNGKDCSRYTLILGHSPYSLSAPMAPWFVKNLGKKVFLVGADYRTGRDIAHFFRQAFEKEGGKVVGEFYSPLGNTEYAPYLSQIRSAKEKPDGVFGMYLGTDLVNFVRQFSEFGLKQDGYIYVGGLGPLLITLLPSMGDACLGFYDCFHTVPYINNPQNTIFMNAWKNAYPNEPIEENGMLGFDVGTCVIKALDAVGGDAANTEALADALHTIEYDSPRGRIKMAPNHCAVIPVYARKVVKQANQYRHESTLLGHFATPCGSQYEWGTCKLGCPS